MLEIEVVQELTISFAERKEDAEYEEGKIER